MTTDIVERLRCFEHPNEEGEAVMQLAATEIVLLRNDIANTRAIDIHSCHANCTRAGCVNARLREEVADLRENGNRLLAVADSAVQHQKDMIDAVAEPLRDRIQALMEEASCIRAERDNARADRDAFREDAQRYRSLMGKP